MTTKQIVSRIALVTLPILLIFSSVTAQSPQPPSQMQSPAVPASDANTDNMTTYQGQLKISGVLYTGKCDFKFDVYDAATGGALYSSNIQASVPVTQGLFTTTFMPTGIWGSVRWLEVSAGCPTSNSPTWQKLSPRQKLTTVPYAQSLMPGADVYSVDSSHNGNTEALIAGYNVGLTGKAYAAGKWGVLGQSLIFGTALGNSGVVGLASNGSFNDISRQGMMDAGGSFSGPNGVIGVASSDSDYGFGVTGITTGSNGFGVYAVAPGAYGIGVKADAGSYDEGNAQGVYGQSRAPFGAGVIGYGVNYYVTSTATGVIGRSASLNGYGGMFTNRDLYYGEKGGVGLTGLSGRAAYLAESYLPKFYTHPTSTVALLNAGGEFAGANGIIAANSSDDDPAGNGVVALASSGGNAYALWAIKQGGGNYAGVFYGNVFVNGTLSKSGGSFKIDHPLDPAGKYLSHSFVESPDMMNVYNGNVTTDAQGDATVQLPDYFETLNKDFRYQLTVIGQFAQAIVAEEVKNNSFSIKTDKPNVKVSWQVTGIRQDAWANANRIQVEEDKPIGEQGTYLYPAGFNQPDSKSVSSTKLQKANLGDLNQTVLSPTLRLTQTMQANMTGLSRLPLPTGNGTQP